MTGTRETKGTETKDRRDELTDRHTAFRTLAQFCDVAERDEYKPTLAPWTARGMARRNREVRELADAFDAEMAARGSGIRAWRGSR